jgi:hypothetical protein
MTMRWHMSTVISQYNWLTMILNSINKAEFLETVFLHESLKIEVAGIHVWTTVWPDTSTCMVLRIPIRNHMYVKGIMEKIQDNVHCEQCGPILH